MINGVSAIAIRTRHLDRLLHFYCETLDFRLAAVLGGCDATGARQREVVLARGPARQTGTTMCFLDGRGSTFWS